MNINKLKSKIVSFLLAIMVFFSAGPMQVLAAGLNESPEKVTTEESIIRKKDKENESNPINGPPEESGDGDVGADVEEDEANDQVGDVSVSTYASEQPPVDGGENNTEGNSVVDENIPDGDPEGTVTSKDGKTRITRFDVKWKDTDELVISDRFYGYKDSRRNNSYPKEYENWTILDDGTRDTSMRESFSAKDIKLDWSISGERTYKPGQIKINLPEITSLGDNHNSGSISIEYKVDTRITPVPKLVRKNDGNIDINADYGKSDYAWEIVEGVFSLINIRELLPGTTGTATVSYERAPKKEVNYRLVNDSSIVTDIKPNITIDLSEEETLKKEDKTLSVKLFKAVNISVDKHADYYSSWNEEWGDNIKPKNSEDYEYVLYGISTKLYTQYAAGKLKLEDSLSEDQEILGFRNSKKNLLKDDSVYGGFEKYDKSMNGVFEMDYPIEDNETENELGKEQRNYLYLLVKVPYKDKGYDKPEKDFSVRYRNDIKATLTPYEKSIKPATDNNGVTITRFFKKPIPDAEFKAPPGDTFGINKYSGRSGYYDKRKKFNETKKLRPDQFEKYEPTVRWEISSMSNLNHLTRNENLGDANNPDSYGQKNYKYIVSDDYVYLNGDYNNELSGDDYEVSEITLNVSVYDYGVYNNNKSIGYHKVVNEDLKKTMPTAVYGRKISTGKWEKLATFDYAQSSEFYQSSSVSQKFKPLVDGVSLTTGDIQYTWSSSTYGPRIILPSGYSSVKVEVETNNARIHVLMAVNGKLKRSERVLKAIEDSKTDKYPLDLTLRNDATLSVYDEDNKLVAIKGTSERDENNSRTLDLDKENYGAEMYHDTAYYNVKVDEILKPQLLVDIKKEVANFNDYSFVRLKARNNVSEQRFEIPVAIRQTYRAENVQDSDFLYDNYNDKEQGVFYDLLPLGVTSISNLRLENDGDTRYGDYDKYISWEITSRRLPQIKLVNTTDENTRQLDFDYELIPNWRNSGRTMLVVRPKNIIKEKTSNNPKAKISMMLEYTMYYPWESYEDYGGNIDRNLVGYNVKNFEDNLLLDGTKYNGGVFDNPQDAVSWYTNNGNKWLNNKFFKDHEIPYYENIGDEGNKFVYAKGSTAINGNTIAVTGLHKHVKSEEDSKYVVETKVKENGNYSYRMRFVSESGTTTRDLILYDSLENYDPLESNKYYGKEQWKGTLESIDTTQAELKGADPKVYVSTVENLNIKQNRDLNNIDIWKLYKEGDELSNVKAVAIDLTKKPDGSKFELPELQSINVILHMRAPYGDKDLIGDMALNQVFANNTPIRKEAIVENDLIDQANTAVYLEPIEGLADVVAKKEYVDRQGKPLDINEDQFEFKLTPVDGSVLKDKNGKELKELTATNDAEGNIKFDTLYYNSWDVGKNPFTRTHTYKLEEVKGNDDKISYDSEPKYVKVLVERDGDTDMKTTVTYWADKACTKPLDNNEAVFVNEQAPAKVKVIKVSSSDKDKRLANAEFELYKVSETEGKEDTLIQDKITTNDNGESDVIDNLDIGKYYFKEVKAPNDYVIINENTKFEITEDDLGTTKEITISNEPRNDLPNTGKNGANFIILALAIIGIATMIVGTFVNTNKKYSDLQ